MTTYQKSVRISKNPLKKPKMQFNHRKIVNMTLQLIKKKNKNLVESQRILENPQKNAVETSSILSKSTCQNLKES